MSEQPRRYVTDSALYLTDNGRVLCGRHCGTAAAYTGMDISGEPIEMISLCHEREWRKLTGTEIRCEECQAPFSPESDMALTRVRGLPYPARVATCQHFTDTSWHNDLTDSVSFAIGDDAFTVWVEALDPRERSVDWGWTPTAPMRPSNAPPYRYTVHALEKQEFSLSESVASHQLVDGEALVETDSAAELIEWVATRHRQLHHDRAGSLCHEGPDGLCTLCSVDMSTCDSCQGVGYHRANCAESDETTPGK